MKDVADLIAQAAEAAKLAPEHLQEIAFSKAFDALAGVTSMPVKTQAPASPLSSSASAAIPQSKDKASSALDKLDRTAHSEIHHGASGLDNSLRLLRAARKELGMDGLTAAEIARVLTDKFRARITRQAVGMALNSAGRYVNRYKEGSSVLFQIMGPGETYLDSPKSHGATSSSTPRKSTEPKTKAAAPDQASQAKGKPSKATSKASSRVGPDLALRQLYDRGFFSSPRTIGNITDELKHGHGRTYKSSEMSPVLLRYLRNGDLTRAKNKDSQYEYTRG